MPARKAAAVAVLALLAGAAPAAGQEPGVHYDPDSPAGKQYAIPLEQARDIGGAGTTSSPSAGAPSSGDDDLFGAGIAPKPAKRDGGARKPRESSGKTSDPSPASRSAPPPARPAASIVSGSDGRQLQLGAVVLALALLAGAGGGLVARRALRRTAA